MMVVQKMKRRKKKRRNTTLFVPPPVADAFVGEDDGRDDETRDAVPPVEEEEGTANVEMSDTTKDDEIDQKEKDDAKEPDYKSLCQTYKDEHASLRFLLGILKLEKADAESRLGQLSEAFATKSAQNKTMAAQLTELRRENAALKTAAVDKEMDSLVGTLQTQMMTGLSAAVEKTKTLQAQLEAMAAEKERLEEELEELRG
jgi:hypothetical protein